MTINIDKTKFEQQFDRFIRYVLSTSGESQFHSFSSNETTSEQEGYKLDVYDEARQNLDYRKWLESDIGTGNIHESSINALRISGNKNNLVDWRLIDKYANKEVIKTNLEDLEQALFDLFNNRSEESEVFEKLVNTLGANYSLIAYFFFIKDKQRFLPISTTWFDRAFELIGVTDYRTTQHCNWDNYQTYNLLIEETQSLLNQKIKGEVFLLDAHSFLWMISRDLESETKPALKEYQWKDPEVSSVKREIIQRQGQDIFRKKLLQYWNGRCSVTGFDFETMLIASHIKPWKDSDDTEKFDVYNGLLLTPNLDKLFDRGLISFENDGELIVSPELNEDQQAKMSLNRIIKVDLIQEEHSKYLEYHRNNIFIKS